MHPLLDVLSTRLQWLAGHVHADADPIAGQPPCAASVWTRQVPLQLDGSNLWPPRNCGCRH